VFDGEKDVGVKITPGSKGSDCEPLGATSSRGSAISELGRSASTAVVIQSKSGAGSERVLRLGMAAVALLAVA
jgi:hypothetical protein